MDSSSCQLPDQPCFNSTEQKLSPLCPLSGTFHIIQDPFHLGCGKISINDKSCFLTEFLLQTFFLQAVTVFCCSSALPHDGMIHRLTGIFVPDDGCLSLIRDTDRRDILCCGLNLIHCLSGNGKLSRPDLTCIVLHPARLRKMLDKFLLCHTADLSVFVKQNTAVAGRSGIQRHNIFCHKNSSNTFLVFLQLPYVLIRSGNCGSSCPKCSHYVLFI